MGSKVPRHCSRTREKKTQEFTLEKKDWIDRDVLKEYSIVRSHGVQANGKVYIRDCGHQTCNTASAAEITEGAPAVMDKKKGVSRQGKSEPFQRLELQVLQRRMM